MSDPQRSIGGRWDRVAVGLGGNLEPREANLMLAVICLADELLAPVVSPLVVSQPVDCPPGSPDFLNAVLVGLSAKAPDQLLAQFKAIEHRAGRRRAERNAPRVLDCDLLVCGRIELEQEELRLPHHQLAGRQFWTAPLAAVAADLPIPGGGTAAELTGNTDDVVWRPWSAESVAALREAEVTVASAPGMGC